MIDLFALVLVHGLLAVMFLRLAGREALDVDPAPGEAPEPAPPPPRRKARR